MAHVLCLDYNKVFSKLPETLIIITIDFYSRFTVKYFCSGVGSLNY